MGGNIKNREKSDCFRIGSNKAPSFLWFVDRRSRFSSCK